MLPVGRVDGGRLLPAQLQASEHVSRGNDDRAGYPCPLLTFMHVQACLVLIHAYLPYAHNLNEKIPSHTSHELSSDSF